MPRKKIVPSEDQIVSDTEENFDPSAIAKQTPSGVVSFSRRFGLLILIGVLLLALGLLTYLYLAEKKKPIRDGVSPSTLDVTRDTIDSEVGVEVLRAVSELMILPEEQDPIIATIADAERLRNEQAFYHHAENGDILLVFPQNRQAVIYRPGVHKIVNVGPLIIDQNEQ